MKIKPVNRFTPKPVYGFTLIEILVVLFIISIIVTIAVVSIGNTMRTRTLANTAEELTMVMQFASDEAILASTPIGFKYDGKGYQFYRYIAVSPKTAKPEWQSLQHDRILGLRKLTDYVQFEVIVQNISTSQSNQEPSLILNSDGTIAPFTINIGEKDQAFSYQLQGKSNGDLALKELE